MTSLPRSPRPQPGLRPETAEEAEARRQERLAAFSAELDEYVAGIRRGY